MPMHIFGEMPLDQLFAEPYATMPVGNGPFKAVKFVDGQYMEMDANPDFYRREAALDKYIVRFGDPDTLTAALEARRSTAPACPPGRFTTALTGSISCGNPVPRDHPEGFIVNFERFPDHGRRAQHRRR